MATVQRIYAAGPRINTSEGGWESIADIVGGATLIEATGNWVAPDGEYGSEPSYIVETVSDSPLRQARVLDIVEAWAAKNGELGIMVTSHELDSVRHISL